MRSKTVLFILGISAGGVDHDLDDTESVHSCTRAAFFWLQNRGYVGFLCLQLAQRRREEYLFPVFQLQLHL